MTSMEWVKKQKQRIAKAAPEALKVAAIETHRQMMNRIFVEGKNADNRPTGKYNTTDPIYVNPKNSPRKFSTGKHKNGKPRKTKRFNSYAAFRAAVGRETNKVNLNLSGQLQSDATSGLRQVNKNEWVSVLKNPINQKKKAGQEKRFKAKIFSLTKGERSKFYGIYIDQIRKNA